MPTTQFQQWQLLPIELHMIVAEFCDNPTICSLRLTSRSMRKVRRKPFLLLFKHIAVYLKPWSLPLLVDLVKEADIAASIRTITFLPIGGWERASNGWMMRPEASDRHGDFSRDLWRQAVLLAQAENAYTEGSGLEDQLVEAVRPLKNLYGLAFDVSPVATMDYDCDRPLHQRADFYIEAINALVQDSNSLGLGLRSFLREQIISRVQLVPHGASTQTSCRFQLPWQAYQIIEQYFCFNNRQFHVIMSVFARERVRLRAYRDYGFRHERPWCPTMLAMSSAFFRTSPQPVLFHRLTSLHLLIVNTTSEMTSRLFQCLGAVPDLKCLRFEASRTDEQPDHDLRHLMTTFWTFDGLQELHTLTISCIMLLEDEYEDDMLTFLRSRAERLKRVVLVNPYHVNRTSMNLLRCVRDDLRLSYFAVHYLDCDHKSEEDLVADGLNDGEDDDSANRHLLYLKRQAVSIVWDGDVKRKAARYFRSARMQRRTSWPMVRYRPRLSVSE